MNISCNFRNHFQNIDPFVEMKRKTFHSSDKAIDVILSQLDNDIGENINISGQRDLFENKFLTYLEVKQ